MSFILFDNLKITWKQTINYSGHNICRFLTFLYSIFENSFIVKPMLMVIWFKMNAAGFFDLNEMYDGKGERTSQHSSFA